MTKRAVLYARVSSDDRRKDGRNLTSQIEMCREYALEQGYEIVAELAEDDRGASGASWDLPMLNQALTMARAGDFDVLVVRELDRFARELAKQLVLEAEFKRAGVEIMYVLADYDDTPAGQLQKHVRAVIAEYEKELIKARMLRGRYNKVKSGSVLVSNRPPYGYRVIDLENGKRTFEVYEPEARIVRSIYRWCIDGDGHNGPMGLGAIANELTRMGVPTRRHADGWATTTVGAILSSATYYGKWRYGKAGYNGYDPVSVDVPAIVDRETWDRAQQQRKANRRNSSRHVKYEYLVRRFAVCGECQAAMTGLARKRKRGPRVLYYRCAVRSSPATYVGRQCHNPTFRADAVDAAVWAKIKEWTLDRKRLEQEIADYQAEKRQEGEPYRQRLTIIDELLEQNHERLERILDLYEDGRLPKDTLIDREQRLTENTLKLEQERANLAAAMAAHTLTDEQIASIFELQGVVQAAVAEGDKDFATRRKVIETLRPQVTLVKENGQKVAWITCALGNARVTVDNMAIACQVDDCNAFVLTARVVLPSRVKSRRAA